MGKTKESQTNEIMNIGIETSEILLDSFLEEGVVKEFPIVKTIMALYKSGKGVKEYYSVRKLIGFLNGCSGTCNKKIINFKKKLGNEKYCTDVGMKILLIVDKVDAIEKAELIGKALVLLIDEKIELEFYMRLCNMIDKCFYYDLKYLQTFLNRETIITSNNPNVPTIALDGLFSIGLISDFGFDGGDVDGQNSGTRYGLNDYGECLKFLIEESNMNFFETKIKL